MTARDEAIDAIKAYDETLTRIYIGSLLNAIPPGVLARLAIERGALREAFVLSPELGTLYRVVEP